MRNDAIREACHQEIVRLHRFFVDWYHGTLPPSDQAWSVLPNALAAQFELISPGGHILPLAALLETLRAAHASRDPELGFRIWIREFECRHVCEETVIATYQEWQHLEGRDQGRQSTVIFERCGPEGIDLRWLHVHETWLPSDTAPSDA